MWIFNKIFKKQIEQAIKEILARFEDKQKHLWDTEDIWIKLWEMAYSKAVDAVWPILQKEMLHINELAEQRAYLKSKAEFEEDLSLRMKGLIESANGKDAVPFIKILALKKTIEDTKLIAERVKNTAQVEKCFAQLEVIGGLL